MQSYTELKDTIENNQLVKLKKKTSQPCVCVHINFCAYVYGCMLVFRDCRGVWGAFYVRECLRLSCVSSPGYTPAAEKLQRPINAAVCPGGVEEEETERGRGRGNLNRGLQQICRV